MNKKWVVDASSLIILGKLSLLHILTRLCDDLVIPDGVAIEILNGPPGIEAGFRISTALYKDILEIVNE